MKISLLTYGSRGDVEPYVALAVALKKAGHSPRLAAPGIFSELAGRYEIPFIPLSGDPVEISRQLNNAGQAPVRMVRVIRRYVSGIAGEVAQQAWQGCQGVEMIVHSFLFTIGAHAFAHELGIPDVSAQTFPTFAPTRAFPNVALASLPPGWMSYLSHWLANQVFWYGGKRGYAAFRKSRPGILPEKLSWPFKKDHQHGRAPLLFGWSPSVLPAPKEWDDEIHVIGYWILQREAGYQPLPELANFLDAGEPPVCVSFGSMVNRNADLIHGVVVEALREANQRGVILKGWGGLNSMEKSADVLVLDEAAHDWLLPRCKAIIHHGGAGTTGAGLRAGIPNMVVPLAADQFFWGKQVWRLGAGPAPIGVKKLTVEALRMALAETENQAMRMRAKSLGERIRAEDGLGKAVGLIEKRAAGFQEGKPVSQP